MLPGAAEARGEQLAYLSGLRHDLSLQDDFFDALRQLSTESSLDDDRKVIVREVLRDVERARSLPRLLVCEISRVQSETYGKWLEARKANSFSLVRSQLEEILKLRQQYAACLRPNAPAYDTLLDDHSRLDRTTHPFCTNVGPADVRLTTRYQTNDLLSAVKTSLHEWGHALYDLGYRKEWMYTPLGEAASLSIHESQSLLWEKHIGGSTWFWSHWFPRAAEAFPKAYSGAQLDSWLKYVNRVGRTLIRVEADEVTYGLHVIIRFKLEQALVEDSLAVSDLPEAWRAGYRDALGIAPDDDRLGALQDVHWYHGMFGYFPSYLAGAILSAQIFDAALIHLQKTRQTMSVDDLPKLRTWLKTNIHEAGRRWTDADLIEKATGRAPAIDSWKGYLDQKYS